MLLRLNTEKSKMSLNHRFCSSNSSVESQFLFQNNRVSNSDCSAKKKREAHNGEGIVRGGGKRKKIQAQKDTLNTAFEVFECRQEGVEFERDKNTNLEIGRRKCIERERSSDSFD